MRWSLGAPIVGLAVIGFTVLIAATSHTSVLAPTRTGVADPVVLVAIVAIAFLVCLLTGGGIAAVRRDDSKRDPMSWVPPSIVTAVLVSLLAISGVELRREPAAAVEQVEEAAARQGVRLESDWRGPAVRRPGEEQPEPGPSSAAGSVDLFRRLVLLLGAVSLAVLIFVRRTRGRTPPGGPSLPTFATREARSAAHGAVVGSIAAMLADPDPRTAIIGAYARLQEDLGSSGASRREYEGPTEHLERVLSVLEVRPPPLQRLIALFEIARFSERRMTLSDRDAALGALRDVAADLAAPAVGYTPHEPRA